MLTYIFVLAGTEATTGARTDGAVQKSRWRGPARIQTRSSSPTKGSIYTFLTHISYRTSHNMLIRLPRNLRGPFQRTSFKPMKPDNHQNKAKNAPHMWPVLVPCLAQAELMITCKNRIRKRWVLEGCLKMWCLLWFETHRTTICLLILHLRPIVLPLLHHLPPCLGLPIFPIRVSMWLKH